MSSSNVVPSCEPSDSNKLDKNPLPGIHHGVPKDWKFWTIIFSLALSVLLTAVEFRLVNATPTLGTKDVSQTAIGAALPTIVCDLEGEQFIWVGSAYALGSTALVPLCGGLAQIIGRRPIMLSALSLFALGSTICGVVSSMTMLIAGRAVQGLGAGAITASMQIILSDLVTLRERGTFTGLMALSWAIGGGVGPVVGGSLAENGVRDAIRLGSKQSTSELQHHLLSLEQHTQCPPRQDLQDVHHSLYLVTSDGTYYSS
ncbi:major facilitator superfamily domain-containing protein [Russula brevipes]|nr:major facilitator superfamily domain-containing protein [Russula brevipes]